MARLVVVALAAAIGQTRPAGDLLAARVVVVVDDDGD